MIVPLTWRVTAAFDNIHVRTGLPSWPICFDGSFARTRASNSFAGLVTFAADLCRIDASGSSGVPRSSLRREAIVCAAANWRSEEHTSELQSLMRISYAVFCLKKKKTNDKTQHHTSN